MEKNPERLVSIIAPFHDKKPNQCYLIGFFYFFSDVLGSSRTLVNSSASGKAPLLLRIPVVVGQG